MPNTRRYGKDCQAGKLRSCTLNNTDSRPHLNGFILSIVMIALGTVDFIFLASLFLSLTSIFIIISIIVLALTSKAKNAEEISVILEKGIFNKNINKKEILNKLSEEYQNVIKSNQELYNFRINKAEIAKWFFFAGMFSLFASFTIHIVCFHACA